MIDFFIGPQSVWAIDVNLTPKMTAVISLIAHYIVSFSVSERCRMASESVAFWKYFKRIFVLNNLSFYLTQSKKNIDSITHYTTQFCVHIIGNDLMLYLGATRDVPAADGDHSMLIDQRPTLKEKFEIFICIQKQTFENSEYTLMKLKSRTIYMHWELVVFWLWWTIQNCSISQYWLTLVRFWFAVYCRLKLTTQNKCYIHLLYVSQMFRHNQFAQALVYTMCFRSARSLAKVVSNADQSIIFCSLHKIATSKSAEHILPDL